ncbi:MAG: RagB/SusD family nutrient uptake outer membrane protein [Gemmatimonadaceae bacterium]
MTTTMLRTARAASLACLTAIGVAGCSLDVVNPSVIDASTFNPNADGTTLALSSQTNFFIAFQSVAMYGGLISDELWSGAARLQTNRLGARVFASTDDINTNFFAPLSLAIASNENAIGALQGGPGAATDLNLARASMNLGFSLELMAETMCAGVIQGGPQLSDAQLIDSAITRFTSAVAIATAAGSAGTAILNEANVGLARAYLQKGDYAHAGQTAALVPANFVANVITSANVSTQGSLGNAFYGNTVGGQIVAPARYRIGDPRIPIDSTRPGGTLNGLKYVVEAKYNAYGDQIRLASGLEAQYIAAEAAIHGSNSTSAAITLINARRTVGGQGAYGGATDSLSVVTELLNQRARDFWLEGKKLGDLRRNPSVALASTLTDPNGSTFYAPSKAATFGSTFCAPIPPQETNANPNFKTP